MFRNRSALPRTKIIRREQKEPLKAVLMKVAKNRVFVISLVLVIVGVSLIKVSYNFPDTYVNTNLNTYNASVSSNGEASIIFTQPYNLTENITFGINSQYTVHYRLYLYYHVD